jgi:DNA-binding response OmpR family regulator
LGHEDKIDLLFTDVILPDKTGREIADILRESRPDMKILYTSGYTENSIAHHGVIDSGIHFLPKPYRPKEMVARIRQILNGME